MIAIDLSKQQALDDDSRAIQQINFTANLDRVGNNTTMFFIKLLLTYRQVANLRKALENLSSADIKL